MMTRLAPCTFARCHDAYDVYDVGDDVDFGITLIAVVIIDAMSATFAGRMTVFAVFARFPKRSM